MVEVKAEEETAFKGMAVAQVVVRLPGVVVMDIMDCLISWAKQNVNRKYIMWAENIVDILHGMLYVSTYNMWLLIIFYRIKR